MVFMIAVMKLKSLILYIIAAFRRALCCFRRRRQVSCDADQLTHVGVVSNQNEFENWSEWEQTQLDCRKPESIQEHIELYRKQKTQAILEQSKENELNEQDFFGDMAPKITRQKKVLIATNNPENISNHNLSLVPDNVTYLVSFLQFFFVGNYVFCCLKRAANWENGKKQADGRERRWMSTHKRPYVKKEDWKERGELGNSSRENWNVLVARCHSVQKLPHDAFSEPMKC